MSGAAAAAVGASTIVSAQAAPLAAASTQPVAVAADAPNAKKSAQKAPASAQQSAAALAKMGPSQWKGGKLRHPRGGKIDPKVVRWANVTLVVMDELNIPKNRLPGILAQMQQESSGNPKAVNKWDSNARRGTPSKGLLQVIAPTYRHYAKKGFRDTKYQTVPYTNIYAALSYVKDAYGYGKFKSWNNGANQGY